ncbi:LacI family DNA-binding transcriptional regulator [Xylanimonas protaetiae]|uniref:LacI family DNA-binding transcriptional regulator n=1 Tax=Xylanimonas protaetiae TaxID=2509457 RepID=UPI001F5D1442|nr:LacI family DNA-binding transcriptional regulator [Xylanimonas protaetiae]
MTITEVARRAGVSPATVSRVMNDRFVGDPAVAERVRATATELDYTPSPLARGLALGRTQTVGFLVPDLANPSFHAVLSSIGKAAAPDGYRLLVTDSGEQPQAEPHLALETRRRCDGIVLCAPRMPDAELLRLLDALRPVVLVNRPAAVPRVPSVGVDYGAGMRALAQHLVGLGHRDLVYLEGPAASSSNGHRLDALAQVEREQPDIRVRRIAAGSTSEDGYRVAGAVAASGATAALAFNDLVAVGLLGGLRAAGLRVPEDVSVTGFDDIPSARYAIPSLTTASVPVDALGAATWARLHALLTGGDPEHDVMFSPRLEPRDSTAPPRPHGAPQHS